MAEFFFVEVTDTFSGEANYSWVRRYKVRAQTFRGAIRKVSRELGYRSRYAYDTGDMQRYEVVGACICMFVQYWPEEPETPRFVKDL